MEELSEESQMLVHDLQKYPSVPKYLVDQVEERLRVLEKALTYAHRATKKVRATAYEQGRMDHIYSQGGHEMGR